VSRLARPVVRPRRVSSQLSIDVLRPAEAGRPRRGSARCPDGGGPTLGDRIAHVWEGLHAVGVAECPLCRAAMERATTGEGVCRSCGTRLA